MPVPFYWVDTFTDGPFSGNPAGVCILEHPPPDRWMRQVANEIGLSETAFVVPRADAFLLRWYTPATEVDLCGHATLAAAHALWHSARLAPDEPATFLTRSGRLTASRQPGRDMGCIWLNLPATPPIEADPPAGLLDGLGVPHAEFVGRTRFDFLVQVENEDAVAACQPDFAVLRTVDSRGVIVTARGTSHDFVSRFFAPALGVDEDPVTGSAHCTLAPFWARLLGRTELNARQLSRRGGVLDLVDDGARVQLGGRTYLQIEGTFSSEPERSPWPELS